MTESRSIYSFPRNLVLAASAGTGKTHALVGVAVHLLLGACASEDGGLRDAIAPERLVATTFSRRAAAEIRARLGDELERLTRDDPKASYREDLAAACRHAGLEPFSVGELALRARRALHGLGRAKIGTLHSFAATIARKHALLLGLSPDFELPDEETTRERAAGTIEQVLDARAANPDVSALIQLAGSASSLVDLLRRLLARVADDGRTARELMVADGDAAEMDATFERVLDRARDVEGEPRLGEQARAVLAAHSAGDSRALEVAMGALWSVSKGGKPSPAAAAFFELRDSFAKPNDAKLDERGRAFVRRWSVRDRIFPRGEALKALLVASEEEIDRENARDSILGFAEILRAARDVLRDHPDVARDTSSELDALLVDEFQDTSAVQRDLVQLVWEAPGPALRASGVIPQPAELRRTGLLIVGDRKQSIYAFRGADVAVFAELCVGLAGAPAREALAIPEGLVEEPAAPIADFVPLRHNRRGQPALLTLANALSRLSLVPASQPAELYEVTYVPETEDLLSPETPGREIEADSPRTLWLRFPIAAHKKTTSLLREAEAIAHRIASIVREGSLAVRGAPARWADIAILAPRHEVLSAAAYTLALAGIPHVVAGMGFYGAREVRDAVAMLACVVDPDDSLSRAEVLRGPWAGVSDRTLIALTDRHGGLADVERWSTGERRLLIDPGDQQAVAALAEVILRLRPMVGRIGAGSALRDAAHALKLEETLALMPRGEQRLANLRKLFAIADDATDATELLRRLRRRTDLQEREGEAAAFSEEDDAVRLLTVHASKGLAFPIVFLPDAGAAAASHGSDPVILERTGGATSARIVLRVNDDAGTLHDPPSYLRAKKDLARRDAAERRRLRYVATTRASEAMFFVGDRALPKSSHEAYATSTASLLAQLAKDADSLAAAQLVVDTDDIPPLPRYRATNAHPPRAPHRPLPLAPHARRRVILAEGVREATHCLRRYQLAELVGAGDRAGVSTDLVTRGDWGARIAREAPRIERHQSVALSIGATEGRLEIVDTGSLRVEWDDGTVDLVAFAAAAPEPATDKLYASVLAHGQDTGDAPTRVGLLEPKGNDAPVWVGTGDKPWTLAAAREVAARIVGAPRTELAPRVPEAVCRATGCRQVDGCYPKAPSTDGPRVAASGRRQTAFGFFEAELRVQPTRRGRRR